MIQHRQQTVGNGDDYNKYFSPGKGFLSGTILVPLLGQCKHRQGLSIDWYLEF